MDEFGFENAADDKDSPQKGGHTLRRRARVDYTFEHIDDEVVVPSSTSSTRTRKRKSDNSYDSEEVNAQNIGRRRASLDADTPSSRRRNPARKSSAEVATYIEEPDEEEGNVQDTIEVEVTGSLSDGDHPTSAAPVSRSPNATGQDPQPPKSAMVPSAELERPAEDSSLASNAKENSSRWRIKIMPQKGPRIRLTHKSPGSNSRDSSPSEAVAPASAEPERSALGETPGKAETSTAVPDAAKSEPQDEDGEKPEKQLLQEASAAPNGAGSNAEEADEPEKINGMAVSEQSSTQQTLDADVAQEESKAVSAKEEAVDETAALDGGANRDTPITHLDADAVEKPEGQDNAATSASAIDAPQKDVAKPSSPSSQVQKQLDESPNEATVGVKMDPDVEGDADVEDADDDGKPGDEPMEDEPQAEPAEISNTPTPASEIKEAPASLQAGSDTAMEGIVATKPERKPCPPQDLAPPALVSRPQPTPAGRWAYLTPYVDGEYVTYPEKKESSPEEETPTDEPMPEDKDADKDSNGMEPIVDDNEDAPDASQLEVPTPALNTPTRGSPVPESMEPTASNSPAQAADEADDGDVSDSDDVEVRRFFRYRKLRDPEDFVSAIEKFEDMSTTDLYELVGAMNVSLVQWQTEWTSLGKIVDDYENALRRRLADSKYESRTRNLHQHGINYEEPEFVVKGYKAKEKEIMSETRYLQGQDRIMAAAYGFEYDPHPSKIGRQNPETQQAGIMTRGRSLRNQPRQTAKATETDEVTGKRTRKPVQLFDPAAQDISRSSTPVPTRGKRRRNGNGDDDMVTSSFNGDATSDVDEPPSRTKRRRAGRPQTSAPNMGDDSGASQDPSQDADETARPSRRGRHRAAIRYDDGFAEQEVDDEQHPKLPKRHILTLKIPRGKNFSEPSSAITDNGDSRPSTADSESSSHTAESSYSFRPKRQKRFRDEEEAEAAGQGPPKKRGRRVTDDAGSMAAFPTGDVSPAAARKTPKIKVVRAAQTQASRTGTPSSVGGDADEPRKDYKLMTKSEKMSASMKSRWANGNMAGAVEKRKATLAAKKAAQAAADQKSGTTTPKGSKVKPKKDGPPRQDSQPLPPSTPGMGYPFSAAPNEA
ncbi:hypothetical protein LMH87_006437 [Akanthomyces muscarius]|uniref:Uncharacterized protein n=1 Tax=Akanthomyces muscarius TaxID=2231603 RepID=A0A9W8QNU6_AKAMU|nr:hypothetical protein LMH87_006437 [Akanthomyces muscarius]KAJ4164775.1 hypothetical protein LMH87_006437 [Akanthomyces muscarius]